MLGPEHAHSPGGGPRAFATMTVGALNGGRASNIIPDTAEIMVSFRTLSPEAYDHLLVRIPEILDTMSAPGTAPIPTRVAPKPPSTVYATPPSLRRLSPSLRRSWGRRTSGPSRR